MNARSIRASAAAPGGLVLACAAASAIVAPAHAAGPAGNAARAWPERLRAPAQFDLALAEISFPGRSRAAAGRAHGAARRARSLRLATRGASGLYYVAGAVTRSSVPGRPRALVLVVNRRPRGSLAPDLAAIGVTVSAPRRLGRPLLRQLSNPLTRPSSLTPPLCDLPIRAASLAAADLRALLSRGPTLGGFGAAAAIAQAYNLICHRPHDQAFVQVVTGGSTPPCEAAGPTVPCCPPNAICPPPPCPPCPCGPGPCVAASERGREAVIPCPLASPPIACPL
jgi:hypothetical protein